MSNGEEHVLTFSDCHPDKFTCSDGSCIGLDQKCDSVIDCEDGTDETECQFLVADNNYAKEQLPFTDTNQPVQVSEIFIFPRKNICPLNC